MELTLSLQSFNSLSGYGFSPLRYLIESSREDFGGAVSEIELTLFFRSSLPFEKQRCNRTLKSLFNEYHKKTITPLPTSLFLRKKRRLVFGVLAEFATAEEKDSREKQIQIDWQHKVLDSLTERIQSSRRKFKKTDDFRVADFLEWLSCLHDRLPKTQKEARAMDQQWREFDEKKMAGLSDWEKLGLDFDDYHADARKVVDDPDLWCLSHDFAPNGNDSGADLLDIFRKQKSRIKKNEGRSFLKRMGRDWEFDPQKEPDDSIEYETKREVVVALAFSFLKVLAFCPDWLVEEAVATITSYSNYLETNHRDWEHRDLCLDYQRRMLRVLDNCPREEL